MGVRHKRLGEAVLTSTHILFFLGRNKKNNVYPCKPHFYYIKVWFKGGGYIGMFFCDELKKASALFKFTTKHVVVYIILT